jgi:hypothetical protein
VAASRTTQATWHSTWLEGSCRWLFKRRRRGCWLVGVVSSALSLSTHLRWVARFIHMHDDALAKALLQLCAFLQGHVSCQATEGNYLPCLVEQLGAAPAQGEEAIQPLSISWFFVPITGEGCAEAGRHGGVPA